MITLRPGQAKGFQAIPVNEAYGTVDTSIANPVWFSSDPNIAFVEPLPEVGPLVARVTAVGGLGRADVTFRCAPDPAQPSVTIQGVLEFDIVEPNATKIHFTDVPV